jgi:small subunit ribosomal protein S17
MAESIAQTKPRKQRSTAIGVVTSAHKTPKTIRVEVSYQVKHRQYGKYIVRSSGLLAHDEKEVANKGDRVQLMQCRPFSKRKTWRLIKVLEQAPVD